MNDNKVIMGIIAILMSIVGYYNISDLWILIFGLGIAFIITGLVEMNQ
jgi:hypothetical protein